MEPAGGHQDGDHPERTRSRHWKAGRVDGFNQGGVFHAPTFGPAWKNLPAWPFPGTAAATQGGWPHFSGLP